MKIILNILSHILGFTLMIVMNIKEIPCIISFQKKEKQQKQKKTKKHRKSIYP